MVSQMLKCHFELVGEGNEYSWGCAKTVANQGEKKRGELLKHSKNLHITRGFNKFVVIHGKQESTFKDITCYMNKGGTGISIQPEQQQIQALSKPY
jgi:hypothetical protein